MCIECSFNKGTTDTVLHTHTIVIVADVARCALQCYYGKLDPAQGPLCKWCMAYLESPKNRLKVEPGLSSFWGQIFGTFKKPETQVYGTHYITNFSLVIHKYQYLTGCTFLDTFQYYHYVSDTSLKSTKQIYENITKKNVVDFVLQLCFLASIFMTSQTI